MDMSNHFKHGQISSKRLDFATGATVACVKVRAFQLILNQSVSTGPRAYEAFFLGMEAQMSLNFYNGDKNTPQELKSVPTEEGNAPRLYFEHLRVWTIFAPNSKLFVNTFQKNRSTRSQARHKAQIWSALESPAFCVSNGRSNVETRSLGASLIAFEITEAQNKS